MITGFGRLGAAFAAEYFGVVPDMITCAKGLTNGTRADGRGVRAQGHLRRLHAEAPENAIELFHGYTYSGHPLACAAALARSTSTRRKACSSARPSLADYWEDAVHSLQGRAATSSTCAISA